MTKFDEYVKSIKQGLKSQLSPDLPKDKVDEIAKLDTQLDALVEEHNSLIQENQSLKDGYVELVKNTSFKGNPTDDTIPPQAKEKTLDDIIADVIAKRK